jgi:hypothetical protein
MMIALFARAGIPLDFAPPFQDLSGIGFSGIKPLQQLKERLLKKNV